MHYFSLFLVISLSLFIYPTNASNSAIFDKPLKDALDLLTTSKGQTTTEEPRKLAMGAPMVDFINKQRKKFTARRYNRFENLTKTELKAFLGAKWDSSIVRQKRAVTLSPTTASTPTTTRLTTPSTTSNRFRWTTKILTTASTTKAPSTTSKILTTTKASNLPTDFDISTKWPQCKSTFETIEDQSQCGSCWAVSTAAVVSDRRCIVYNGTKLARISSWDLVSCCSACRGNDPNGCNGGWPSSAFNYYAKTGIVTGGGYQKGGCKPYPIAPKAKSSPTNTTCSQTCQSKYKKATYVNDKKKGGAYTIFKNNNTAAMVEIMARGSIIAIMDVYQDFYQYSSGVYEHSTGSLVGGHAVRVVGWGVTSDGVKFWRVANSWGIGWGESGYFRIERDTNECGFEEAFVAGIALKN